ncbi:MAG: alpha/beta-hydrolase N-terminal domain-containing protein, partial [Patescibacteria group bacterium]
MNKIKKRLARYAHSFSLTGLFLGLMFVAASMTPSLLPRPLILQGLLSGVVFAIGYGVGVFLVTLWKYFELHELKGKWRKRAKYILMGVGLACVICTMFFWRSWQNSILTVMDEPIMEERHFVLVVIGFSIIIAVILIALGRLIGRMFRFFINKIHGLVPRRISRFAGFLIALVLLIGILNGVLIRGVYNFVDSAYGKRNDTTDEGVQKPTDSMKVGSTESLIDWESIGRTGRNFISHSPNADEIKEFTGQDAKEPLRVYVGLQTRDSYEERANLALEELKRINAFERKVMILTTPTGTGWMDPYAVYTLEYMHGGDTANV